MTKRFTKDDVEFHSDMGRTGHAAVNVKVYSDWRKVKLEEIVNDPADVAAFSDYLDNLPDEKWRWAWDAATQQAWEQLNDYAAEVFGHGYGVFSEGRSGGWAVVHYNRREQFDREDVERWDAIALSKWARFRKYALNVADDVPYLMVDYLYSNHYPPVVQRMGDVVEYVGGAYPFRDKAKPNV